MNAALSRVKTIRTSMSSSSGGNIKDTGGYSKEYKSAVPVPGDAANLSAGDLSALRSRILPASAWEIPAEQHLVQHMIQDKDPKTLAADSNYRNAMGEVKKYEAMEKIYLRITDYKTAV